MAKPSYVTDNPETSEQEIPLAEVTIGDITPDDNDAKYQLEDNLSIYADYKVNNRFESDKHRYMMAIASPDGFQGASVAFVQLAAPTLLWIADWTCCRVNIQPKIPDPGGVDADWVLLDEFLEPATMSLLGDGKTPVYRISGTYVYGHKNPNSAVIAHMAYPRPPWLIDTGLARNVSPSSYAEGIISTFATVISPPGIIIPPGGGG